MITNQVFICCAALMLAWSVGAGEKAAPAKGVEANAADAKAQQGVWKPVNATLGGTRLPPQAIGGITLKLDGDKYEVTVAGEGQDKGTCRLDANASPKRMVITGVEGPNKGKTFPAIYEFKDADTLRICYDLSGAAHPAEFASGAGTKIYLVTYARQKH